MKPGFWGGVAGATRYEFWMQWRRKALWISLLVFLALSYQPFNFMCFPYLSIYMDPACFRDLAPEQLIGRWSLVVQFWMPVALGILLADRLPRDRRTGARELLDTFPAAPGGRLLGKYLGTTLAALFPVFLVHTAGVLYFAAARGEPAILLLGLAAFATVNLPGFLFVAAFSITCTTVLWVPLYQFLFVGYWFWGNLLNPVGPIPTLSGTWLTPVGGYAANGLFDAENDAYGSADAAAWEGFASISLLLALTALALYTAHRYLLWTKEKQ